MNDKPANSHKSSNKGHQHGHKKHDAGGESKNKSFSSVDTQRELRVERLNEFKKLGINPFTPDSKRDEILVNVKEKFEKLQGKTITIAGRVKRKRTSGKIAFATVEDESLPEGFQFVFKKDDLPSQGFWSLNFRIPEVIERIKKGKKTIETRALNPEEKEDGRYFGDIQPGDVVELVDVTNNESHIFRAGTVELYESIDDAWDKELDFEAVKGEKYDSVSELKKSYSETLTPQYLNKIQTNGLVAITLEKSEGDKAVKLSFEHFKKLIDEGDYIQATGILEPSQSGEPSLFVHEYTILTKALRPLPEELDYENVEARYLDRVVDFKMNTRDEKALSVREMIKLKSKYWAIWREEMLAEGFLEVETPVFEGVPGGADAKPFTTFYNELDEEVYLRISLELPQKKLIAGGFEKVFEIGRIFRNEGASPQHLQEYTQIEWYLSYANFRDSMPFMKRVYQRLVKEILGSTIQVDYYGNEINWGDWCSQEEADKNGWELVNGWPVIKYFDAIRYYSNGQVDLENKTFDELMSIAQKHDVTIEQGIGFANLMDKIYKKVARVNTKNPFFLALPPAQLTPLAKRNSENPDLVERWQIVAGTAELGICFTELNDPIDQLERFEEQQTARDNGDEEAQFMNKDYVRALEYGTPPMTGFGASERVFSFLLSKNIKEAVTFPAVRSENQETQKSKKTQVAHAVLLNTPEIPNWSKLNAAAHLAASFAAREGKKLIWIDESETLDGEKIPMNIQHAIIMKQTDKALNLLELKNQAEKQGLIISCFTEEMRDSSNDQIVDNKQSGKSAADIGWLGVLVFGKKSDVEELTEGFERMS